MYYLYTDEIAFASLKSQLRSHDGPPNSAAVLKRPPLCSPKSMWRIADKYGLDKLKVLAKADMKQKVPSQNVVAELFSSFSTRCSSSIFVRNIELTITSARLFLGTDTMKFERGKSPSHAPVLSTRPWRASSRRTSVRWWETGGKRSTQWWSLTCSRRCQTPSQHNQRSYCARKLRKLTNEGRIWRRRFGGWNRGYRVTRIFDTYL